MTRKLTIWCNAEFPHEVTKSLESGTKDHRLIISEERASNLGFSGPSASLAEADIAFGQPDPGQIMELPNLRWIHLTSAGYTRYDRPDLRQALTARGAQLTNSSMVFDEPCAQHLLAFMLAKARQLPECMANQLGAKGWDQDRYRHSTRLLRNQTVLLLGFGAIARRLTELLAPFHLRVIAVRQTVRGDEPIPTYSVAELPRLVGDADHVIDVLPANPSTERLVDAGIISRMKPDAIFYNIGRGTTVDQVALIAALAGGRLGGAYLDVTEPEPLAPSHPLWSTPNCYITPHIGGGHKSEEFPNLVAHFLRNLKRFEAGETLLDRVI